ncbi:MAG: immunoglobulin-like domain-containing protein [Treponema sp.]
MKKTIKFLVIFAIFFNISCSQGSNNQGKTELLVKDITIQGKSVEKNTTDKIGTEEKPYTIELDKVTDVSVSDIKVITKENMEAKGFNITLTPKPITEAKPSILKIAFENHNKYNNKTIFVKVLLKPSNPLKLLTIKTLTIHNLDAKDGSVSIPHTKQKIEKGNIHLEFNKPSPPEVIYSNIPLTLEAGKKATIILRTERTQEYEEWKKEIEIDCPALKKLTLAKLTIYDKSASSGRVLIPTDKNQVKKENIVLEFADENPPQQFKVMPETLSLANAGDKGEITISTDATEIYEAWNIKVNVIRSSGDMGEKTIEECVASLESSLLWNNTVVENNIVLPATVEGFANSTVEWASSDEKTCTKTGEITRDLEDVEVTLTCKVSFKSKQENSTFKVIAGRVKQIRKKKDVNGNPYVYMVDLSKKGTLEYSENGIARSSYEIKNIDIKTKDATIALKKLLEDNSLVSLEELFAKIQNQNLARTEAQFGMLYKKLVKSVSIEWEDFKKYIIAIDKEESKTGTSNLNTDEQVFNYVKDRYQEIGTSWSNFNSLDASKKTTAIKGFLKMLKDCFVSLHDFKNVTEDNIFKVLLENRKLESEYNNSKRSSAKPCKYVLEKTTDLNTYPDGYRFLATAIYDPNKNWNEQHGDYHTEKTASIKLGLEAGHTMKDGRLVAELTYEDASENYITYRGIITGNKFITHNSQESIEATLNDTKDQNLSLNITKNDTLKGNHQLKFIADTIGFKD